MKSSLLIIIFLAIIPAIAEGKDKKIVKAPNTYSECIQKASDINDKWIEYKDDANKCRDEFGIPEEYYPPPNLGLEFLNCCSMAY